MRLERDSWISQFTLKLVQGMARPVTYVAIYTSWIVAFRLLVLTLITYFLMASNSRFQEISDAFASNELMLMGLSAFIFVLLLRGLNPLTSTTTAEIFTPHRFEKRFAPGFLHGAVLALGVTLAFLLSGLYRYLGFFIQFEEAPLAVGNVLLRIMTLGALVYCEEFIFRHKIMNSLRKQLPDIYAALITALLYCAVKAVQFDLGLMHLTTLFLLSLSLALRSIVDGDFSRAAGFAAGLLVVFHPLLSLPILGNDFQGILLVKYQAASDLDSSTSRFLTGGVGGPLSSFALQFLFLIDVIQGLIKNKKILLNRQVQRIR